MPRSALDLAGGRARELGSYSCANPKDGYSPSGGIPFTAQTDHLNTEKNDPNIDSLRQSPRWSGTVVGVVGMPATCQIGSAMAEAEHVVDVPRVAAR